MMMVSESTSKGELRSLTSLRGLAAMAVVLQHFSATAQSWCRITIPSIVPHGYVAVDFFFVLSGFIMIYTYGNRFKLLGIRAYPSFLANRVARIFPLNLFALLLILVIGLICKASLGQPLVYNSKFVASDFFYNLFLLEGLGFGQNLNAPAWSISVEFSAYIIFPVLLTILCHSDLVRRTSLLSAVAALLYLAEQTPRMLMTFESPPWSIIRCIAEFFLGMSASRILNSPRLINILMEDKVSLALCSFAVVSLLTGIDLPAILIFPFIIVSFTANAGWASRIAQFPPFYFLGEISFSLYLLHNPFRSLELLLMQTVTGQPVGPTAALSFAILGSLSVIPVAWFGYRLVERPGRVFLRRVLGGSKITVPPKLRASS